MRCHPVYSRGVTLGRMRKTMPVAAFCLLGAAVLVWFALLWPGGPVTWMVTCWFLPAFVALFNGQDAGDLTLWVALAAVLVRRDRRFLAGMVLALCASKYHLAILLPIAIL